MTTPHNKPAGATAFFSRHSARLILIAVIGLLSYSNTFKVPFHFDDFPHIVENPVIADLTYFMEPSRAKGLTPFDGFKTRYISYLTFALNYKFGGVNVSGYHAVNLAIHTCNAFLVYFLVILTFRTPCLGESTLKEDHERAALFAGLLFISHPVQTQAVTFITQRFASLAAMFYLASIVLYVKWRLSITGQRSGVKSLHVYLLSFASAVLAMETKENAFTLPAVITLYEFMFFKDAFRKRAVYLIPLLLTFLIIPMTVLSGNKDLGDFMNDMSAAQSVQVKITRADYMLTQFSVVTTYIRLLFLPVSQNLDYDFPVFHSFMNARAFLSCLFIVSIITLGIYIYFRSKKGDSALKVIAFGIFWFFIALTIESSVFPMADVLFEHRAYLPYAGAFPAVSAGIFLLSTKIKSKNPQRLTAALMIILTVALSAAAYARNNIWANGISLWEDVVKKSPQKPRAHYNLANRYFDRGLTEKAIEHYGLALRLRPDYAEAHNNVGNAYRDKGSFDKAIEHYNAALKLMPGLAEAHYNLGIIYTSRGSFDKAAEHLRDAIRLKPYFTDAHNKLGVIYGMNGSIDRAIEQFNAVIALQPNNAEAHFNLGIAYRKKGLSDKTGEHFLKAKRAN